MSPLSPKEVLRAQIQFLCSGRTVTSVPKGRKTVKTSSWKSFVRGLPEGVTVAWN